MLIARATDTPQMLRMSILARSVKGTHDVQAPGLPQFPVMRDLKPELNFAAFCQASLPPAFHAMHAGVEPARAVSDRIIGRRTP
jgi:hypothetical protein